MRTWLSKTMGYVTEKPADSFTGVTTDSGEKIYEGDLITIVKNIRKYVGKYHPQYTWRPISEKEYKNPKNWKVERRVYSGIVYFEHGAYFINMPDVKTTMFGSIRRSDRIQLYERMNAELEYNCYGFYRRNYEISLGQ